MPVGATLAVAGAGVTSAVIGANAAGKAAKTEAAAANRATDIQQQMYNQTRSDLGGFREAGASFLPGLQRLLGVNADGSPVASTPMPQVGDQNIDAWLKQNPDVEQYYKATPAAQTVSLQDFAKDVAKQQASIRSPVPTYTANDVADWRSPQDQALEATPGYKFARDQGIQSVNRSLGSMGLTGAQAKGIARFVTGLADQTYGEQYGRTLQGAQLGENAAAQTGSIGSTYGQGISNTIVGAGQASAAGQVGAANAISGGLSSIPSALIYNKLFSGGGAGGGSAGGGMYSGAGYDGSSVGLI